MKPEVPDNYPETPAWTMFFDGPLYRKYDEFMKGLDFSKILLTSKLKLANSDQGDTTSQSPSKHEDWWEGSVNVDLDSKIANPNIYSSVSEEYYQNYKDDQDRRKRKTRAFIVLALILMAALAFGTALVIHYFFIPSDDDLSSNVNISLSENITGLHLETTSIAVPTKLVVPIAPANADLNPILKKFDDLVKKHTKPTPTHKVITPSIFTRLTTKKIDVLPTSTSPKPITTPTKVKPTTTFYDLYEFFGMDDQTTTSDVPFYEESTLASTTDMKTPQTTSKHPSTTEEYMTSVYTPQEPGIKTTDTTLTTQVSTSETTGVYVYPSTTLPALIEIQQENTTVGDYTKPGSTESETTVAANQTTLSTTESLADVAVADEQSTTVPHDLSTHHTTTEQTETTSEVLTTTTTVEQTTLPEKFSKSN